MKLRKGKVLPEPKPLSAKEKGKEIQQHEEAMPPKPTAPAPDQGVTQYNILAHLKKIPSLLSVYDALVLSPPLTCGAL